MARRALRLVSALLTTALVLMALGAAVGRWQVLPARSLGDDMSFNAGSMVVVEPVDSRLLDVDDEIYIQVEGAEGGFRRVVQVTDSWQRTIEIKGSDGERRVVQMPERAWRVRAAVPFVGWIFSILVGPIQSIFLVAVGIVMIVWAEWRRSRGERVFETMVPTPAASPVTHDTPVAAG